ncbi:MAG: mechanosensitive ion channel family protein [Acidobacteriota bacterium]
MNELTELGRLTFLGASLDQWGIALIVAVLAYIAVRFVLKVVVGRLRALTRHSVNTVDDDLVSVLAASHRGLLALMSLLIGVGLLDLPSPWDRRVEQLWFLALALQFGLWGGKAIALFLDRYIQRHGQANAVHASATATLMSWGLRITLWTVVVLAILSNLGVNITAFVASLGVGGIAVALAVQNILGDLFASLSIAIDKPFEVGDFIVVDDVAGSIEFVGLKSTRIRSLGGEQIVMSNTELLKRTISNYKRLQERRVVYKFAVTYETTPDQAQHIPEVVKQVVSERKRLRFDRAHLSVFGQNALEYEAVFFVLDPDYNLFMDEQQAVHLALMRQFEQMGVRFAFPTRTLHVASWPAEAGPPQDQPSQPAGAA